MVVAAKHAAASASPVRTHKAAAANTATGGNLFPTSPVPTDPTSAVSPIVNPFDVSTTDPWANLPLPSELGGFPEDIPGFDTAPAPDMSTFGGLPLPSDALSSTADPWGLGYPADNTTPTDTFMTDEEWASLFLP